jgi:hypothetical protein
MPTAELTLECPSGHRFTCRWLIQDQAIQVPHTQYCPVCWQPAKLVKAEPGE